MKPHRPVASRGGENIFAWAASGSQFNRAIIIVVYILIKPAASPSPLLKFSTNATERIPPAGALSVLFVPPDLIR